MRTPIGSSVWLSILLATAANSTWAGAGHDEDEHQAEAREASHTPAPAAEENEESAGIELTAAQQQMIDLRVTPLKPQLISSTITAPGEVVFNSYRSSVISPQADVRIIQRHVILGDHVEQGQPLVTLFSDELADRMTALRNSVKEWELVKKMGQGLAGKQRYSLAQVALQQNLTKVQAFGLSRSDVQQQMKAPGKHPLGQFVLKAPHQGVIQQDNFLVGQQLSSNDQLFTLVDERLVWIEAQLPANQRVEVPKGTAVRLQVADTPYTGELVQLAHSLSETTRTRMARIQVNNASHKLHPGQFAQVSIPVDSEKWAMQLPENAFTRTPDGDWGVFIQSQPNTYRLEEVEVVEETPAGRLVSGLEPGTLVVTQGTFFLASEQAKAGFDIHNH